MKELGVGIIGFGFIGKVHTYGYINMPLFYSPVPVRTKLIGVATSKKETAQRAQQIGGFEFSTTRWENLINRDDIDIISICSPNNLHRDQLIAAIKAKKHIYCDKPLTVTVEEAEEVLQTIQNTGYDRVHQMVFQYRFYPATLRAKQLIEEGFLGKVVSFRAVYLHSGSIDKSKPMGWKQELRYGGGVVRDVGSHILDLLDHFIGPFDSVMAETRILYDKRPDRSGTLVKVEAEDMGIMLLKLKNGALGTLEASKVATGTNDELRFEIHGDKGALRFNLMEPNYLESYSVKAPEKPLGGTRGFSRIDTVQRYEPPANFPGPKFAIGWIRGHMHCLYNFLSCIAEGRAAEPSLRQGARIQKLMEVIYSSVKEKAWENF